MANETTIPILPCHAIDETLDFYVALGFEITYRQARPNNYACVRRGGIDLHFFSMKEYEPANSYSTCIVLVPDVDKLYAEFRDGLRQRYGKLPLAGIPRVTTLRDKSSGRGFNVIDPGGNWIRISQHSMNQSEAESQEAPEEQTSRLARAVAAADLLAESKGDFVTAAKVLDGALALDEHTSPVERVQALISRAGIAVALRDEQLARKLLAEVRQAALRDDERSVLNDNFERAADLEQMLKGDTTL